MPNLSLAGETKLEHPPVLPPAAVSEGTFALVTADKMLQLFDAKLLQSTDERTFDSAPLAGPWIVDRSVFLETEADGLLCLDAADKLATRWAVPLSGSSLAGRPVVFGEELCVALRDGRILFINAATGVISRRLNAGQRLAGSPIVFEEKLFIPTADGTILAASTIPEAVP